jgi:hypothetical protein
MNTKRMFAMPWLIILSKLAIYSFFTKKYDNTKITKMEIGKEHLTKFQTFILACIDYIDSFGRRNHYKL